MMQASSVLMGLNAGNGRADMRIGIVNDMPIAVEALRRAVASIAGTQIAWVAHDGMKRSALCRHAARSRAYGSDDARHGRRRGDAAHHGGVAVPDPCRHRQRRAHRCRACLRRWATVRLTRSTCRRSA